MRRTIAVLALAGFLPLTTTGCFGQFQLVRKTYQFNKDVSPDKWVRELVFLVMTIIPVYGIASFLDAIIINSIEFWTGKNPVTAFNGATRTVQTADGTATFTRLDDVTLEVTLRNADGREDSFRMTRESDGFAARTPEGVLIARVAEVDGKPAIVERGQ
jgi:hypothetical protein